MSAIQQKSKGGTLVKSSLLSVVFWDPAGEQFLTCVELERIEQHQSRPSLIQVNPYTTLIFRHSPMMTSELRKQRVAMPHHHRSFQLPPCETAGSLSILRISRRAPLRSLGIALPIFIAFGSPLVFADQLAFKNGDRLTGEILKSDARSLVIRTAIAGQVTVPWQEIQELRSDLPLHVELAEGKIVVGRVTTRQGIIEVPTSMGATVEAPK